jgi:DNA repair protein RadC
MDISNAAAELHISSRKGSFRESRTAGICGPKNWANFLSSYHSSFGNASALAEAAEVRAGSELDRLVSAARMDAAIAAHVARLISQLGQLREERLHLLLFDQSGRKICERAVTCGLESQVVGRFRPIVSWALQRGARGLLLAHNHPSGNTQPSVSDVDFTRNIAWLCKPLEIDLLDHVVVAGRSALSMRQAGYL